PENKETLTKILTYHVVAGRYSAKDLTKLAAKHGVLTTVEGEPLTVTVRDGKVLLTDAKGGVSTVTIANVFQSNGVIHVVDTVLMP
ncbi:fasciclin domain-containing protein, partial [Mycobacterium tuberculosis]